MNLDERQASEEMQPSAFRQKINGIFLPIYLGVFLIFTGVATVLGILDAEKYVWLIIAWAVFFVLWLLALFLLIKPWIDRTETEIELKRYAYLFEEPTPILESEVKIAVAEEDIFYTLNDEGFRAEWEQEGEQVFDEIRENLHFVPWDEAEFTLASHNFNRRVHLALAVLFRVEEEGRQNVEEPAYGVYILPITERAFAAICRFGVKERLPLEWRYLFYNPKDAFGQILTKGMIENFRDKDTGKAIEEGKENF